MSGDLTPKKRPSWPIWAGLGVLTVLAAIVLVMLLIPTETRSTDARSCAHFAEVATRVIDGRRDTFAAYEAREAAQDAYEDGTGDWATYKAAETAHAEIRKRYEADVAEVKKISTGPECAELRTAGEHAFAAYDQLTANAHSETKRAAAQTEVDAARAEFDRLAAEATR